MKRKKSVLISFLGNINYDSRCLNLYQSLEQKNFDVNFIGFDWTTKNLSQLKGKITIKKLNKRKISLPFYLKFAFLLNVKLLFNKYDIYFAEDLYTLPFVVLFGKIKRGKIIYDSRELFGYLAGLGEKKKIQGILRFVEKLFINRTDLIIVTGEMDKEFLIKEYKAKNVIILRNFPKYSKIFEVYDLRKKFNIPSSTTILIYQGMIHHGRGLRTVFEFLRKNEDYIFFIVGDGSQKNFYENLAAEMKIDHKIIFVGKVPQTELLKYTKGSDIGVSLIENISLSYFYALPNKLFEYIMAEIPCVVSNLPQMDKVIKEYKVGISVALEDLTQLDSALKRISQDIIFREELIRNCAKASRELNWEKEIEKLFTLLN